MISLTEEEMAIGSKVSVIPSYKNNPGVKKVGIYARVSTARVEQLRSLAAQVSALSQYTYQRNDMLIRDIYIDVGTAKTGSSRREFARLLEDCKNRKVNYVLVKSMSRFGRDTVSFENDTAAGAFYHLMKLDDFHEDRIKKLFAVDCCTEGISISSGVGGELVEVFRRNSELPVQKIVDLMMTYDNVLCFYGGNYRNRELDEPIGTCRIPDQYRGQQIHVKVTLTEVGIVEYVVLDAKKQIIYPRRVLS